MPGLAAVLPTQLGLFFGGQTIGSSALVQVVLLLFGGVQVRVLRHDFAP